MTNHTTDILVIGSGIGGLSLALKACRFADVLLVTKKTSAQSATNWAQGGIAAVTSEDDSFRLHEEDTIRTGAGLCDPEIVRFVVESAPERIRELAELGVRFTKRDGELELAREGGHSKARILHHADQTGQEIESVLLKQARATGRIEVLQHHLMIDLLIDPRPRKNLRGHETRCFGAYVLNSKTGEIEAIRARAVVLATGGSGMVYQHTTNPPIATGDGVVAAWRAGAEIADLEFFQFHPTTLYNKDENAQNDLVTEALRGFGAKLRTQDGEPFMQKYDPRNELASRDIVARAIDTELKTRGEQYVHLDCTHLNADELRLKFPHIDKLCKERGFDFTKEPIWAVPAAHYQCGGVKIDRGGRTNIPGLFAVGEVTMSGLHGANRLASNSLLEAVVFAHETTESCHEWLKECGAMLDAEPWSAEGTVSQKEMIVIRHNRDEIRKIMWDYVGIVRSTYRLQLARKRLDMLTKEIAELYKKTRITEPLVELRNLVIIADLIVRSALTRRESRGLHFMSDYPDTAPAARHTVLSLYSSGHSVVRSLDPR